MEWPEAPEPSDRRTPREIPWGWGKERPPQPPITKAYLLEALEYLQHDSDIDFPHVMADELLLAYINDPEITDAYDRITRYFA